MTKSCSDTNKGVFTAAVRSNKRIGHCFYRISLEFSGAGAKAFADFIPGQFAEFDISNTAMPKLENIPLALADALERKILLRRPFSFCDVTTDGDKTLTELLYCTVGPASLRLTTLTQGDSISVIGPLGNGFSVPKNKTTALLVVGGIGFPPIEHLAKSLKNKHAGTEAIAFVGARSVSGLPFENMPATKSKDKGPWIEEFARYGIESLVTTDDGSAGSKGLVTNSLTSYLGKTNFPAKEAIIYACGPEPMLAATAAIAQKYNIDCQVSMERQMGCGIGLCQSCAVECKVPNSKETIYKMCCKDGPVFDGSEVVFSL